MSHRSMWLGPPNRKTKMQERIFAPPGLGEAARNWDNSTPPRPNRLKPPTRNSSRREERAGGEQSF